MTSSNEGSSSKPASAAGGGKFLSSYITGTANFASQYNFQSVAAALVLMSSSVCTSSSSNCLEGEQAAWVEAMTTASVFLGAIVGQLSMGFLGDYLTGTRSVALAITMSIAAVSAMMTALATAGNASNDSNASAIYGTMIAFRFTLGIGVGGVFPLSATKASEDSSHHVGKVNSISASWAFFWQLPGIVAPWLLTFFLSFTSSVSTNVKWRLVLGLGAVPFAVAVALIWWEIKLNQQAPGVASGEMSSKGESDSRKASDPITYGEIIDLLKSDSKMRMRLFICGGCWFLYNIFVYGLGLLGSVIIEAINDDDDNVSSNSGVRYVSSKLMTAMVLAIPATIFSIYALHHLGMKNLQVLGFSLMSATAFMVAVSFYPLHSQGKDDALFGIYCLCALSMNLGAGVTTFTLPAAFFPKRIRSTFNGFAAAIGKVGAFIGAFSFRLIAEAQGFAFVLGICSCVAAAAALISAFLIDSSTILNEDEVHEPVSELDHALPLQDTKSALHYNKA